MSHKKITSPVPSPKTKARKRKSHHINWHEAASCAIQIELRDYTHLLQFQSEYILGKNNYRIDLLIVKKLSEQLIPKNIAQIFSSFNLFEIKGMGSTLGTDSYYKTIGYAGLFINQTGNTNQYTSKDVTLTFLCMHYPKKLIHHLTKERNLVVEKSSLGVYHINKETFRSQIIVTSMLPPEENLYLRCLNAKLQDNALWNELVSDYQKHQPQNSETPNMKSNTELSNIYTRYLHQITNNISKQKGDSPMVCEGLFNLFGTSSEEIIAKAKQESRDFYQPKLDTLTEKNQSLTSFNEQLTSQIEYLQNLLRQSNIPFEEKH